MKLPFTAGHEESYNPPPEYLPTEEEVSVCSSVATVLWYVVHVYRDTTCIVVIKTALECALCRIKNDRLIHRMIMSRDDTENLTAHTVRTLGPIIVHIFT